MKKQFYYSVHANKDQVQEQETDPELYELLSHLQVSKINRLLDSITKSFMSLEGNRTRLFYGFKYNDYTNLSKLEAGRRVYVHGMKGVHDLKRATSYFNFYVSEDSTLAGSEFFNYVFGTDYPTEYELRTKDADQIKQLLNEAAESPEGRQNAIYINNKDRMLVCRIAERLWASQLNDSTSRLVILLPAEEIYEESVNLLKQLYLLLPQRLRLNMGFGVDCSIADIKSLTEYCDLPVHIFTMRKVDKNDLETARTEMKLKYPIVYFDATNPEAEAYDEMRLSLLVKLSRKLSSSSDAKMTYIEKKVLEDGKRMVSFKNLGEIFDMMQNDDFFWWDRRDLETPEDVMAAYCDQKELMQEDELKKEALYSFYTKMLPWKEYALCLNEMILDSEYPDRDEILSFFADELCYGKILEASVKIQQKIQEQAVEHEKLVLKKQKLDYEKTIDAIQVKHITALQEKQEKLEEADRKNIELEKKNRRLQDEHQSALREMQENHVQEIQKERAKVEDAVLRATEEANSRCDSLQKKCDKLQMEKTQAERESSQYKEEYSRLKAENDSLSMKVKSLLKGGAGLEIQRLSGEIEEKDRKIETLSQKNSIERTRVQKAKLCMVVAAAAAGIFLVGSVVLAVFSFKSRSEAKAFEQQAVTAEKELEELKSQIESKDTELNSQAETIKELQKQLGVEDEKAVVPEKETGTEDEESVVSENETGTGVLEVLEPENKTGGDENPTDATGENPGPESNTLTTTVKE